MDNASIKDKKDIRLQVVLFAFLLMVLAALLIYIYYSKNSKEETVADNTQNSLAEAERIYADIKTIDTKAINSDKFKALRADNFMAIDIKKLKVGKDNPFVPN